MKLAEALLDRAEIQKKITDLQGRIQNNAVVQQDDAPSEDPNKLFADLCQCYTDLDSLNCRINTTNNTTPFDDKMKICDALALRESLDKQITTLASLAQSFNLRNNRTTKSEIKYVATMNPVVIRTQVEKLKTQRKDLDRKIQSLNWSIDLTA